MVTKRKYTKFKPEARKPIDRSRFTEEERAIPLEWSKAAVDNTKKYLLCSQCNSVMNIDEQFKWKKSNNTVGIFATIKCHNGHLHYSDSLGGLLLKCGGVLTQEEVDMKTKGDII